MFKPISYGVKERAKIILEFEPMSFSISTMGISYYKWPNLVYEL
jgi:hypothetical protein